MRKIRVVSQKFDGSLRDEYQARLVLEDSATIVLFTALGTPYYDHRKGAWFESEDGLVEIYFKHKWYNVWHICEQISRTNRIYSNIAMPVRFEGDTLTWVDLDLDFRVHMDGSIELLDEDEFQHNALRMGYSKRVVAAARAACDEVLERFARQEFPFNHQEQIALYERIKALIK
jgi:protein associated with RNAse G/E